jgi:N-acetyl-anhydromuramyl-L-alanine amidase AmpD
MNMAYTNSSLVDYTKISPNCTKPRKNKITKIVIHHMAGNLTVESCGEVFAKLSRKASANYGVGTDGRVGLYVEECNRAWTSGNATVDNQAVTMEVANDVIGGDWHVSDKALEKTIELCTDICKRNNIEELIFTGDKNGNLVAHRYYQATQCPGTYLYSKFPYIANEVNKRLKDITTTTSTPTYTYTDFVKEVQAAIGAKIDGIAGNETLSKTITVSKTKNNRHAVVKPIQKYLASLGYDIGKIDSVAGAKFDKAVKEYQRANTGVIDGEITAKSSTWKKLLKLI